MPGDLLSAYNFAHEYEHAHEMKIITSTNATKRQHQPFLTSTTHALILITATLAVTACSETGNFTTYPGFKEFFESHPPRKTLPTEQERALLNQFRPRVYLANDQTGFIDFYTDYIANGRLTVDGQEISGPITQKQLNAAKNEPNSEFVYTGRPSGDTKSTILAKVEYDTLQYQDQSWDLTFLCYNLVFASSGLLAELPLFANLGLSTIADLNDWHQLDHYVGLTVVLHEQQPIAYFIQQHNYKTSYLVSDQKNWPSDQRVQVDVALRSNELYPHDPNLTRHPAVSFVNDKTIEFVKTGKGKPLMAGWDVTHGQREQEYELSFVQPDDAFYQFKGRLGESRKLPGRDGPPGADYVALPGLMPWSNRLVSAYRPGDVTQERLKLEGLFDEQKFQIKATGINAYKRDFISDWLEQAQ